jgi:hypothetical protein
VTDDEGIVEAGVFDSDEFAVELAAASSNRAVGTTLWFENERVRVWEVLLLPGERGPFHCHATDYFWTVVEPGRGLQRLADGTYVVRDYRVGQTRFLENTAESPLVHDLENVGETRLRFVTVEII